MSVPTSSPVNPPTASPAPITSSYTYAAVTAFTDEFCTQPYTNTPPLTLASGVCTRVPGWYSSAPQASVVLFCSPRASQSYMAVWANGGGCTGNASIVVIAEPNAVDGLRCRNVPVQGQAVFVSAVCSASPPQQGVASFFTDKSCLSPHFLYGASSFLTGSCRRIDQASYIAACSSRAGYTSERFFVKQPNCDGADQMSMTADSSTANAIKCTQTFIESAIVYAKVSCSDRFDPPKVGVASVWSDRQCTEPFSAFNPNAQYSQLQFVSGMCKPWSTTYQHFAVVDCSPLPGKTTVSTYATSVTCAMTPEGSTKAEPAVSNGISCQPVLLYGVPAYYVSVACSAPLPVLVPTSAPTYAPGALMLFVDLAVRVDYAAVTATEAKRAEFELSFASDMAAVLGVALDRIKVTAISPGATLASAVAGASGAAASVAYVGAGAGAGAGAGRIETLDVIASVGSLASAADVKFTVMECMAVDCSSAPTLATLQRTVLSSPASLNSAIVATTGGVYTGLIDTNKLKVTSNAPRQATSAPTPSFFDSQTNIIIVAGAGGGGLLLVIVLLLVFRKSICPDKSAKADETEMVEVCI